MISPPPSPSPPPPSPSLLDIYVEDLNNTDDNVIDVDAVVDLNIICLIYKLGVINIKYKLYVNK